jgi:hypothetical protein
VNGGADALFVAGVGGGEHQPRAVAVDHDRHLVALVELLEQERE